MKPLSELKSIVGESKRTVEGLRVEAGKVAEFARATGADDPVYYDETAARERGHDRIPAPPTFTRTGYFERYRTDDTGSSFGFDLGFDPEGTVHGEQEYDFERPVYVGDVLSGVTTLADVYQRTGSDDRTLTFAVLETVYRDADGDRVVTERRTRIEVGGDDDSE